MTPSSTSQDDRMWVTRLQHWGLSDIAPVFVEVLRPLGAIGGQLLTLTSPLVTMFVAEERLQQIVETLDDPDRLDEILHRLDHEAEQ